MIVIIVGGTGTLGRALVEHYDCDSNHVVCFSRDELKQKELKKRHPRVECIIGDIRDGISIHNDWTRSIDILYHVAALKHIDVAEDNIVEALKTNVQGTINVANWAVMNKIPKVSFSSTDKAVYPINVYGHTKALGEKYFHYMNECASASQFKVFRWGNVLGSRGSVIQSFKESLLKEGKIYLTDPEMTRFWIDIKEAVYFMIEQTEGPHGGLHIPKMKSARVLDVAYAIAEKLKIKRPVVDTIGIRNGEKIHEFIDSNTSSQFAEKYSHDELLSMLEGVV
jgi:UDP-N-acetylglucosamine 4,6-dehydratase/5-epimerase